MAEVRGIYGAPKAFFAPRRMGVRASMKRVTRACAKRPSGEKRAAKRESAEDLVKRRFEADCPNMTWFADIIYVKTRQGWLYLALARRNNPKGRVHHSDHGAQCVSLLLSKTMREHGARPSMGSISSPRGNAAMESLVGIVKSECVHARACATRDEGALDICLK